MFDKSKVEFYMNRKGWTKYRLAKEAGVGQSTLSEILRGKKRNPGINTVAKISRALNISLDNLMTDIISPILEKENNKKEID